MSSDLPSAGPSSRAGAGEQGGGEAVDLAALLRARGAPLLEALERHLPGSREHAVATSSYAFAAAVGLGFDRAQCELAREVAMLHDIGLIYVPAAIASKPAAERDAQDAATWDTQYEAAYQLARGAGIPEYVCSWLLRVRERYDGSGPERMGGDRIPLESRLMRAACVCQTALAGASGDEPRLRTAIKALANRAGGELDPKVVASLITILDRAGGA
jgi:HD-GYP domain-containing protein (c-di-GMP phosphodiesterase class II)